MNVCVCVFNRKSVDKSVEKRRKKVEIKTHQDNFRRMNWNDADEEWNDGETLVVEKIF